MPRNPTVTLWTLSLVGLLLLLQGGTHAEDPKVAPRPVVAPADHGGAVLEATIRDMQAYLKEQPGYVIDVASEWKSTGPQGTATGMQTARVLRGPPRHFRVELGSKSAEPNQPPTVDLICVGDGEKVVTYLTNAKMASSSVMLGKGQGLRRNVILSLSLATTGLDLLLRPDLPDYIHSHASDVEVTGEETIENIPCRIFKMHWGHRQAEFAMALGKQPILKRIVQTTNVNLGMNDKGEMDSYEQVMTSKLTWQMEAPPPATFVYVPPAGTDFVDDIYATLGGQPPALEGKPWVDLEVLQLDGQKTKIQKGPDDKGLVVIFWATWCAPSLSEMPAISQLVKEYQAKGVKFYAVNVGEEPEDVKKFVAKQPFQSTLVLDPRGIAAEACDVVALPVFIVVNQQGTVQAVHQGRSGELKTLLGKELESLVK